MAMVDAFMASGSLPKVMLQVKHKTTFYKTLALVKQPSLVIKVFSCDMCSWTTKTIPALKLHKTRVHKPKEIMKKCNQCGFSASETDLEQHEKQLHKHQNVESMDGVKQRKNNVQCDECGITLDNDMQLKIHKQYKHQTQTHSDSDCSSHGLSPPRKNSKYDLPEVPVSNEKELLEEEEEEEFLDIEKERLQKSVMEWKNKAKDLEMGVVVERKIHEDAIKEKLRVEEDYQECAKVAGDLQ